MPFLIFIGESLKEVADKNEMLETSVPTIFPECASCYLAEGVISFWKNFRPAQPYVSCETVAIAVYCIPQESGTYMGQAATLKCQLVVNGPVLDIKGGTPSPDQVNCPHFRPTA